MTQAPINAGVRIGHVHLKVADLDRALDFYCCVLGFELMQRRGPQAAFISAGGYHHIGLNTWESRGGNPPAAGTTGLYHLAVLYPTRAARSPMHCSACSPQIFRSKAPPITVSAKRFTCATPTTTASSFIGIARANNGRVAPAANSRCSPHPWI